MSMAHLPPCLTWDAVDGALGDRFQECAWFEVNSTFYGGDGTLHVTYDAFDELGNPILDADSVHLRVSGVCREHPMQLVAGQRFSLPRR